MTKYALWKKLRSWEDKYLPSSMIDLELCSMWGNRQGGREIAIFWIELGSLCLQKSWGCMRISDYALAESFSALITLGVISIIMFLVPLQWPWLMLRFFIKMMHARGFKATSFTHEWSNTVVNNHFTWQTFNHLKALLLDDVICWSHCCLCLEVLWVIIIM